MRICYPVTIPGNILDATEIHLHICREQDKRLVGDNPCKQGTCCYCS